MPKSRRAWILSVLVPASVMIAEPAEAQFRASSRWLGPHLGMSAVGSSPSIGGQFEFAQTRNFGIGAFLDFWSYDETITSSFGYDYRYFALAGTGAYHFVIEEDERWDPFIGLALGYYIVSVDVRGSGVVEAEASRLFFGPLAGVRYFFKPTLAGIARVGSGSAYLTIGVDFSF